MKINRKLLVHSKRFLALLLAVTMVTGSLPSSVVHAAEIPAVDTEDAGTDLTGDVTSGDVTSGDVKEADLSDADPAVGEADGGTKEYAAGEPTLAQYTFDRTEFDEEHKDQTTLPYGDYRIWDWEDWVLNYVHVLENGIDKGSFQYVQTYNIIDWTSKWQVQKEETGWTDISYISSTSNAGNYKMIIDIPAKEGKNAPASFEMEFVIAKAELEPTVVIDPVLPGTLAESVKVNPGRTYISHNETGERFYYNEDAAATDFTVKMSIKDAYTGNAVAGGLLQTGDYVVEITPTFTANVEKEKQDNFTLKPVTQKLEMAGLIVPEMEVTLTDKWKDNENNYRYYVVYTGNAITAPVNPTDYTLKVQYPDGYAEDGSQKYTVINADATELTYEWYDENYEKLDGAPVNAGYYYYRITYTGKAGLYGSNSTDITVYVDPKKLTLKPQWKEGVDTTFYPGMTVRDVLAAVTYVAKDEAGADVAIDREHIWGDFYYQAEGQDDEGRTIPFEPVFKLQVETDEVDADNKKLYADVVADTLLEYSKPYRVIFSGNKAVYWGNGASSQTQNINSYSFDGDFNYEVNVDAEVLNLNVLPVTMAQGSKATIDVSKIPALEVEGTTQAADAGKTYENPYVKVYDGKRLYEDRANYKLAEVKGADNAPLASGTDPKISYIWCKQSGTNFVPNTETGKMERVPVWQEVGYYNTIPSSADQNYQVNAGFYKLVVSYTDPEHKNYADPVEIFYKIEKQKIKVVPKVTPDALTETAIDEYDFSQIQFEIQTIPATGAGEVLEWVQGDEEDIKDYYIDWKIEQKNPDETWTQAVGDFVKGTSYRVAVEALNMRYSLDLNYTDFEYYTEGTGDAAVTKTRDLNETLAIPLKDMGTTELKIETDSTKLVDVTYTGEAYKLPDGTVKVTKADGSAVSDVELEYRWEYDNFYEGDDEPVWPLNGGNYVLYVGFSGNQTYKAVAEQEVGSLRIKPKELLLEAVVDEQIKAGHELDEYDFPLNITGQAERDADAFTWQEYGHYPAFSGFPAVSVKDDKGNTLSWNEKYRGGKTYTVYVEGYLKGRYARNYTIKSKSVSFVTVRDNSTVSATSYGDISRVAVTDTVDGMTHVIKPEQGIDYINNYELSNYDSKEVSGNYFAFRIDMPEEYQESRNTQKEAWENAFFKNSVENAGGYVLNYSEGSSYSDNYIIVAFDASVKNEEGFKNPEFKIRWEEGYIETFTVDVSAAILGADLTKAVEPKSIAFNAPVKKMVVGGEQALDVKLTKKLQNDIICLRYTVTPGGENVLCVDENGYAVALDSGKAEVTVTPVREDENGKLVDIPGAKTAKVTITVTDVTAPKIQKVTALDNSATVTYGEVYDGYRREVYVLKGKGHKVKDFEDRIAQMTNQHWEGLFEVAPAYYDASDWIVEEWWKKQAVYNITGLEANSEYTVYVRNVSLARTLNDGCKVTISGNGNVKTFKTTRHQVRALYADFDYGEGKPIQYYRDNEDSYVQTNAEESGYYEVKLSTGSIKTDARGTFQRLPVYEAADEVDELSISLPIKDAAQKKAYVAPKLEYQVAQRNTYRLKGWYASSRGYDSDNGSYRTYYYNPTPYASVDKSGKIKLSGVDTIYVRVLDKTTGIFSDWVRVKVTATPDNIVGKNLTVEVGQTISLTSLVDYKEGNLLLRGNFNRHIVYNAALKKAVEENSSFEMYGDYAITAVKPGSMTLTLADLYCGADKTATVTIKTKALSAATGLKASFLVDNRATMSFNYNGLANKFKVEVTDGRGRIVDSQLYDKSGFSNLTSLYEQGYDLSDYQSSPYYYTDAKGKNYYFFRVTGLSKLSSYSVTVTAIWQNADSTICESSKPVKKAIKTTKMPASYSYLQKDQEQFSGRRGGMSISYYGRGSDGGYIYNDSTSFSSGNTYELIAGARRYAKNMLSDTLTWTSSNKKVATIKANAGTYTATLKAVKVGYTVIEVKSKVTKKVIARYGVYVDAMGTARYNYYCENESQTFNLSSLSGRTYAFGDSAASADYSSTTAIEGTDKGNTYTFTAPADGTYTFWTEGSSNLCGTLCDNDGKVLAYSDGGAADNNFKLSYELTAGEQVSLDVREWTFGDFAATLNISAE